MSPPTKELMKLTLEQTLAHSGHPVLRWMMDNIFIRRDPAGNIKPDKEKSTEKIDGAVAMIMALDRAIRCGCVSDDSIYDSREMLILQMQYPYKLEFVIFFIMMNFIVNLPLIFYLCMKEKVSY